MKTISINFVRNQDDLEIQELEMLLADEIFQTMVDYAVAALSLY